MAVLTAPRPKRLRRKATQPREPNRFGLPRGDTLRREVRAVFARQRAAVLRFLKTGRKDLTDGELPVGWPNWHDFGLGAIDLRWRMTPLLTLTWEAAAAKFAPRVGLDPNAEVVNPHTARMIDEAALAFCDSMNSTTSLSLDEALAKTREELKAGVVDKGESLEKLTKRIQTIFDGAEKYRARRIAQTETSRAVHAAQEQAAIASGVVTGWTWLLSSDACPLCNTIARRAPAVRLGHPFAVIGDNPHYSTIKHPPLHPSCQCSMEEVLDTDVQPPWSDTLHQPKPEQQDLTEPNVQPLIPQPAPIGKPTAKPYTSPGAFDLPARNPVGPTPAEPISDYLPSDEQISKPTKKPKKPKPTPAPKKPVKPKPAEFPADLTGLEVVRPLGGSTGATLVRDPATGKQYVFKKGRNPGHLREEATADELYRAGGVPVPRSKIYDVPGGPVKLSAYHEGKTLGQLEHADPGAYRAAVAELQKHFVMDAVLGNWDVIGMGADNILVTDSGAVLRIDNGGSLRYRAQGSKKSSSQWTETVGELSSLRNPAINGAAANVFGALTDDDIRAQAKALLKLKKKASILNAAPAELKDVLGQRFDYLAGYVKPPKPVKIGNWTPKPATDFKDVSPDLINWGKRNYEQWGKDLTPKEKAAVKSYTGSGYRELNKYLRGQTKTKPGNAGIVPDLDKALAKHPTPEGIVVYRGFHLTAALNDPAWQALGIRSRADLKPGMDLTDTGYTSTSPAKWKAWSGEKLEIRVPKATPGAWVDIVSSNSGELEFLLGREVDTLRIVEVHSDKIVVEALQSAQLGKKPAKAKKGYGFIDL